MSDYFEPEEVLRSYDSALMRRMLGFLRPYLAVFLVSVAVTLAATAGELLMPVFTQRSVDNYILPRYSALRVDQTDPEVLKRLEPLDPRLRVGDLALLSDKKLANLTVAQKRRLRAGGDLLEQNFLVVRLDQIGEAGRAAVQRHPELFRTGAQVAAISEKDLRRLPPGEIRAVRAPDYRGLARLVRIFLAALAGVFLFTFLQVYMQAWVGQMIMKDMRIRLYEHSIGLSLKYIDANPVGRLVTRMTNDVETINELFTTVLPSLFKDFSTMIGVLVTLFLLSPRLALVTVVTVPLVAAVTALFRRWARETYRRVRLAISSLNAFLSEHISGMRIVQLFVREQETGREFRRRNNRLLKANLNEVYVFAVFRPLVDFMATASVALIIYFGGRFLLRDLVSLGVLIAFLNLVRMFYQPVRDLSEKYNILQSAMAGAERVFHLLDVEERIPEPGRPAALEQVRGEIVFDRVCFSYKQGEPVLKDLSFRVPAGQTAAIVGYTGAGKTTITSLLTRLWDVQSGAILLDGVDIRRFPTQELRRRVQSVLQDVFLFSSTVEDNIRLGSDIPAERLQEAIRLVQADGFIEALPEGLKTPLTERGANLSMGQRQLLSFARVLAHDPDVLILDEATGNIDTETEKLIQEALARLLRDRTSLVIAHRLSTIRNADRILVLHKGRLVEEGTHEELLARGGLYRTLYRMQFLDRERV